jgi:putative endonuclease
MATVYILHSKFADKFYTGFTTIQVEDRLERHFNGYYKNKFTAAYSDWYLFCEIKCETNEQARKIEVHIKKMKSKIYIKNLIKYPEIIAKLIQKYKES